MKKKARAITFDFTGTLADFSFSSSGFTYRLYDDVIPTLIELKKRGYKLGVISNAGASLHTDLKKLGIYDFFDVVITSGELGHPKPSIKIFNAALKKLDSEASETLHVGDSLHDDIEGAKNAGIQAIYLNRSLVENDLENDELIVSISNLLPFLD